MYAKKRSHPRVEPENLPAHIVIVRPPDQELNVDEVVVDLSYSGIKIKLEAPLIAEINDQVMIDLKLPKSGIPIHIRGLVKHRSSSLECGLHFIDQPPRKFIDDLIFECMTTDYLHYYH